MTAHRVGERWVDICPAADVPLERGVAAIVCGVQVALFRTFDGALFAVGNNDPFSGANVIARGIVGTRGDVRTVASPLYKQVFDLATGVCLDDPAVRLPVFDLRVRSGRIEVLR